MYNRVILMGRLTADPELKQTQSGIAMCRASIAVERRIAKQGEEKKTDFFDVTFWRQQAEFVSRYFSKGRMIHIEGRLQQNNYTDQNGQKHYCTSIQADNVSFCGDNGNNQNQQNGYAQQQGGYYHQPQQGYYQQKPMQPQYQQTASPMKYQQYQQPGAPAHSGKPPDMLGDFDMSEFEEILNDGEVPF